MELLQPKVKKASTRIYTHVNYPVNLKMVTAVQSTTRSFSSDGYWSVAVPVIVFYGIDIVWYFGEYGTAQRDAQYNEILKTYKVNEV